MRYDYCLQHDRMLEQPYQSGARRPIASRERKVFQNFAHQLALAGVSPNAISIAGMVAGMAAGGCLGMTRFVQPYERLAWFGVAAFVQVRLLANMFDGMVAIETGKCSPLGELYNEVPDRVSDTAILVGLGYASGSDVLLGYAAAGVAVLTAYIRAIGRISGGNQEFCGPMAKPQRMFLVTLTALYCGATPPAWHPGFSLPTATLSVIIAGGLITAWRRLSRVVKTLKSRSPGE